MDKLKYIKLENEDGSYSSSIPLAVDSDHVDVSGTTLTNTLGTLATKTEVQAVASGSPAGVYATVAALTSADPDHSKIYVVSADGHWYYYSNNTWTDGGAYQSTQIADNSVKRSALNYSLTGDLFGELSIINRKINISYNDTNNNLTVSTNGNLFFNNGNGFYSISAQNVSTSISGGVYYLILDVSNTPVLQIVNNNSIISANKNSYYTLAYIYDKTFHALMDKSHFIVNGLKVQDDNVILCSNRTGYIKLNRNDNTVQLSNVFVLENGNITTLNTTLTATSSLDNLKYVTWNGTTAEIHESGEKIDYNRVLFTIYANQVYGTHDILILNSSHNPYELCNIILGNINVSFNDSKIYINNIYIAKPGLSSSYVYANTSEVIEITIPDNSNVYNLYFNYMSNTFELISNEHGRELSGKWWILSIYGNKVYPIVDASNIKVNNIPYYETVINVQTNTALELSMNDIFKKLIDKSTQTKITIVGDSIAHGVGGTGFNQDGETIITSGSTTWKRNPNGYCWANLFKNYIENNYNAIVTNNACTGTNTTFLKNNINTLIPNDTDIVIICYGTNNRGLAATDNYNSVYTTTINDFNSIIAYCNTNNIKYCICSPIPSSTADEERIDGDTSRFVHLFQINNIIKSIASTQKCEYANMYNAINEYCRLTNTTWTSCLADGLHPNDAGYKIMYYEYMYQFGLAPNYEDVD